MPGFNRWLRGQPARMFGKLGAVRAGAAAVVVAAAMAGAVIAPVAAQAGTSPKTAGSTGREAPFVSFPAFLSSVSSARYATLAEHDALAKVRTQAAFDQMHSYVLNLYQGVRVTHSYLDNGSYFDCVITMTQPGVRLHHITKLATPPMLAGPKTRGGKAASSLLSLNRKDAYGNAISCPRGTVPMQRMSLDILTRFPTLHAFLAKAPAGASVTPGGPHRYAVGRQVVTNYGANTWINLWNPSGDFTLSQQWVANNGSTTQTAEVGWVHYPAKFGNNAVLFSYYTADGYNTTGCYDNDCGAFVQTSNAFTLGGAWNNYSTLGGTQWGFGAQYQYYQGNWWLYIQNTAIGYYPGSVYNGGALASGNANDTDFGGETYTAGSNWPQMGSGQWASAGWTQAAYQNTIFYIDHSYATHWSSLSTIVTNPACYTFQYHDSSEGSSWGTYFYFGGPGGSC